LPASRDEDAAAVAAAAVVAAAARPTMGLCADTSKKAALAARKIKLEVATAGAEVRSTASALPDAD